MWYAEDGGVSDDDDDDDNDDVFQIRVIKFPKFICVMIVRRYQDVRKNSLQLM
jgi:hypothetical protein